MTKHLVSIISLVLISYFCQAQKGNNQLKIIAELGIPGNETKIGFGGFIKGLYGVGHSAQLTLSAGVSKFTSKSNADQTEITTRLIPVLAGYKQNIHKFYLEPQLGFGEYGGKIKSNGDYARPSVGAFFWAFGAGYDYKRLNIGIRYQSAHGAEGTGAGLWHDKAFHFIGIQAGIDLF